MTPKKPYWEMTTAELRRATKQYDAEFSADNLIPPPAEELAKWQRAKKKMGRPRVGQGISRLPSRLNAASSGALIASPAAWASRGRLRLPPHSKR